MRKISAMILVLLLLVVLVAGCSDVKTPTEADTTEADTSQAEETEKSEIEPVVWKFSAVDRADSKYIKAFRAMWDRVEAETNGAIKVEIYDLNQLGDEADVLQSLQTGSVQAAQMSTSNLAGYNEAFNINDLPFIFDSLEHSDRFAKTEEAAEMNAALEEHGFCVWYWGVLGYKQPNLTKACLHGPEDFVGLKWRTMESTVQINTVKALGAVPMTIAYSEVYNALSMGVVDAWMNDAVAFKNLSTYEVAPYSTEIPLFASMQTCIISKKAYDSLTPENQQIVKNVVIEEMPGVIRAAWDQNQELMQTLKETGFKEYNKIEDISPYFEMVQSVYNDFIAEYPDCEKYIDAINGVR